MVVLSAAYVPLAVALDRLGSTEGVAGFVTFYLALALAWGVGAWLRSTRAAEAERRRHVAEDTRAAERTRIARELHDVVTHHVTAMVVQAEAARYLTAAPDRLDQTLTAVTDTGRRAITDLRHLLDLLNPDHGTEPPGRRPSASCARSSSRPAGPGSRWSSPRRARPAESTGSAELVAYRVVQEALTNALKYAHGSRTAVRVQHGEREITVEVSTDGSGSRAGAPRRERAGPRRAPRAGRRPGRRVQRGPAAGRRLRRPGPHPRREPVVTAPIRVLVCDDQALIRTGFATIIDAQPDLEVVGECGDGRAAVDLAGRLRPDVVVMDVRMPVLDGIEATRLLAGAGVAASRQGARGDDVQPRRVRLRGAARGGERVPAQGRPAGAAAARHPHRRRPAPRCWRPR